MIRVTALKQDHIIYINLQDAIRNIYTADDIFIIGLDATGSIQFNIYQEVFKYINYANLKFFLYLEEPSSFAATECDPSHHWKPLTFLPDYLSNQIIKDKNFLGFITHLKETCSYMNSIYNCPCFYLPLYTNQKNYTRIIDRINSLQDDSRPINFLYWGTWKAENDLKFRNYDDGVKDEIGQYYNRGGKINDIIIDNLLHNNINCTYTYKFPYESNLSKKYPSRINIINLVNKFLDQQQLDDIYYESDIFMLPADQVRSASISYAMSFGIPCIVTNNWGFSEYCIDNYNSIVIDSKCCENCRMRNLPVCGHILNDTHRRISELCNNRKIIQNMSMNTLSNSRINYTRQEYIKKMEHILNICNINYLIRGNS